VGGFAPFLTEQIGLPVTTLTGRVGVEGWPDVEPTPPSALFVPALGFLLGGFARVGTRFDFGADFFRKADIKPRPTKKYLVGAAILVFFLAGWLVPDHHFDLEEEEIVKEEKRLGVKETEEKEALETLEKKLKDLRSWTVQGPNWVDVLREITLAVPETKEVYLTQVKFSEGGEPLKLLGRGVNEDAVNRFVNALTKSGLIRLVQRRTIQHQPDRKEKHRWDFELNTYLVGPEEVAR
jgi:hypothetical protein